jgi:hypothetical protein
MLNFVENLLENERDPRSGPMNDQDHSLSLSDPDRSLVLSHFLTNFLQNLASCHTALSVKSEILFCKWGRLGNERSELTNPTNKIKSLLTRPSYIYFLYNWCALH